MSKINLLKVKKTIKNNLILFKFILFTVIFSSEFLIVRLLTNTSHTGIQNIFQPHFLHELPFYFVLIFLLVSKKKLINLKSKINHGSYFYLFFHGILGSFFCFYMFFIMKNGEIIKNNPLFDFLWYFLALSYISMLFLFFFPFKESKKLFLFLYKEVLITFFIAGLFWLLIEKIAYSWYFKRLGMISVKIAVLLLQEMFHSMIVNMELLYVTLRHGYQAVSISPGCGGIIGYVVFIFFFMLYFFTNRKKIDKIKSFIAFFVGFSIFYVMDVVRNFLFLFVWIFNSKLGVELFHSNLRHIYYVAILLILFFIFRNWLIKKDN